MNTKTVYCNVFLMNLNKKRNLKKIQMKEKCIVTKKKEKALRLKRIYLTNSTKIILSKQLCLIWMKNNLVK